MFVDRGKGNGECVMIGVCWQGKVRKSECECVGVGVLSGKGEGE